MTWKHVRVLFKLHSTYENVLKKLFEKDILCNFNLWGHVAILLAADISWLRCAKWVIC